MNCTLSHPIPAKYDAATEKGHVTQLCTFLQGRHTMITMFTTMSINMPTNMPNNMPTNMPTSMMNRVKYVCLSTRYGGCVSLRHKCYWVWMKALVAYEPNFLLRNVLMAFLKRRFRIIVSMLRGCSILWTTLWINA